MYSWKLVETLINPLEPEWQKLSEIVLGKDVHADRQKSYLLSREALLSCLNEWSYALKPLELNLLNYHTITSLEQFTISLAHTKNCGAAMVGERKNFRSLGIDIEHKERLVKEPIQKKISNKEDVSLRNIELWCLKEAVFKTLMNSDQFQKPIEFSSIIIGDKTWRHSLSQFSGTWELEEIKQYVVARAFLKS